MSYDTFANTEPGTLVISLLISLALTVAFYCAIPLLMAKLRKTPVTGKSTEPPAIWQIWLFSFCLLQLTAMCPPLRPISCGPRFLPEWAAASWKSAACCWMPPPLRHSRALLLWSRALTTLPISRAIHPCRATSPASACIADKSSQRRTSSAKTAEPDCKKRINEG